MSSNYDKEQFNDIYRVSLRLNQMIDNFVYDISKDLNNETMDDAVFFVYDRHPLVKTTYKRKADRLHYSIIALFTAAMKASHQRVEDKHQQIAGMFGGKLKKMPAPQKTDISAMIPLKRSDKPKELITQVKPPKGLTLSERVWDLQKGLQRQIECAISVSLKNNSRADLLAKEIQKYLKDPDKLFRRVRDKYGYLVPSKNMQAFHPGRGVYKSSYKNALRLARTELNRAYRIRDYERAMTNPYIIGWDIRTSHGRRSESCRVCEALQGRYPKSFLFTGWHPQCMCFSVPILTKDIDFAITSGQAPDEIKTLPNNYIEFFNKGSETQLKEAPKPQIPIEEIKRGKSIIKRVAVGYVDTLNDKDFEVLDFGKGKVYLHNKLKKSDGSILKLEAGNVNIAEFLAKTNGETIKLIPACDVKDVKTPDSFNQTLGVFEEYKTVQNTFNAIQRNMRSASKQADNIVFSIDGKFDEPMFIRAFELVKDDASNIKMIRVINNNKLYTYKFDK